MTLTAGNKGRVRSSYGTPLNRAATMVRRPITPVTCLNAVLTSAGGVGRYPAFFGHPADFCGLPRTAGLAEVTQPRTLDRPPEVPDVTVTHHRSRPDQRHPMGELRDERKLPGTVLRS